MKKTDIQRLPESEQSFIYDNDLQAEDYDTIKWLAKNYDLAVYLGWL